MLLAFGALSPGHSQVLHIFPSPFFCPSGCLDAWRVFDGSVKHALAGARALSPALFQRIASGEVCEEDLTERWRQEDGGNSPGLELWGAVSSPVFPRCYSGRSTGAGGGGNRVLLAFGALSPGHSQVLHIFPSPFFCPSDCLDARWVLDGGVKHALVGRRALSPCRWECWGPPCGTGKQSGSTIGRG